MDVSQIVIFVYGQNITHCVILNLYMYFFKLKKSLSRTWKNLTYGVIDKTSLGISRCDMQDSTRSSSLYNKAKKKKGK